MATVFDVAEYILSKTGTIPALKLQKLCYYAQAWSLVWDEKPLYDEEIQAWANGPVVSDLYTAHRLKYSVNPGDFHKGSAENLSAEERDSIDKVVEFYGERDSQWLSDLTHMEAPWHDARAAGNLEDGERGREPISHASIAEYYSSL